MNIVIFHDRADDHVWPVLCHTCEDVTKVLTEFAVDNWEDCGARTAIPNSPALIVDSFYGDKSGYFVTVCDDVDFWRPTR